MVDFRHDAAAFFYYLLMNIASLMMFTSFGFFLVCATPMVWRSCSPGTLQALYTVGRGGAL
jgi:hypothetical protein